jgi:hypothetical protein
MARLSVALAGGYARGFAATAIIAGLGLVLALVATPSLRVETDAELVADAEALAAAA